MATVSVQKWKVGDKEGKWNVGYVEHPRCDFGREYKEKVGKKGWKAKLAMLRANYLDKVKQRSPWGT